VWNCADAYVDPVVVDNCRYFLEQANAAFEPYDSDLVIGYFRSTYVDNVRDRFLKRIFSDSVGRFAKQTRIMNSPDPKSIAVVSSFWNGHHAVYRAFEPYVRELGRHYRLTLVDLNRADGTSRPTDPSMFDNVLRIESTNDAINVAPIVRNDFQLAYYPDMGMSQESIYLAMMRLAPIQCMGTGHPVTSGCREMDYFISGAEVETADSPEENYDERLVLLPGLSAQPAKPGYAPLFPEKPEHFIVNIPWMHMKNNLSMAELLKTILERAKREVHYSMFPGCAATRNSSHMAMIQDYARLLPQDRFYVHQQYAYEEYMRHQEKGRFTMHSYPFGGGTTAVDALVIGCPLTVLRGRHEYNRFSASLLERIGMGELVADSREEWIELCLRLIDDDAYLADVTRRVREADLDAAVFRPEDAGNLKRAFDTLIANHESFRKDGSRKPIEIA
jgi:predicted O-linked N-acetylglucosamine transferase (SPINDLY family)